LRIKEDLYVTKNNGDIARFYDTAKNKYITKVMVLRGTPCEIIGVLGKGIVRIRCKNINGDTIEGDELMSKIDHEDKGILV